MKVFSKQILRKVITWDYDKFLHDSEAEDPVAKKTDDNTEYCYFNGKKYRLDEVDSIISKGKRKLVI